MGDHGCGHECHGPDVKVVDMPKVGGCDVSGRTDNLAAGIVDEDVDARDISARTEGLDSFIDDQCWSGRVAQVGADCVNIVLAGDRRDPLQ